MLQVCPTRQAYLHEVVLESLLLLSSRASPYHPCQCRDHGTEGVSEREGESGRKGEGGREGGREGWMGSEREGGRVRVVDF